MCMCNCNISDIWSSTWESYRHLKKLVSFRVESGIRYAYGTDNRVLNNWARVKGLIDHG
jgi:hypothetical protein